MLDEKTKFQQPGPNLETRNRSKNIVIFGLEEKDKEDKIDLWESVMRIIVMQLGENIRANDIEDVFRLGRRNGNKVRPILVKFSSWYSKYSVMANTFKLRGSQIWISNDYSPEVRDSRRRLILYLKMFRNRGDVAVLKYDKIKVNNELFDLNQCEIKWGRNPVIHKDQGGKPMEMNSVVVSSGNENSQTIKNKGSGLSPKISASTGAIRKQVLIKEASKHNIKRNEKGKSKSAKSRINKGESSDEDHLFGTNGGSGDRVPSDKGRELASAYRLRSWLKSNR